MGNTFETTMSKQTALSQTIKKYGYLSIFIVSMLPLISYACMRTTSFANAWAYFPLFFVFVLVPIFDVILGKDSVNVPQEDEVDTSREKYYRVLTLLCVPLCAGMLAFSAWVFVHAPINFWGKLGWVLSIGMFSSVLAINTAHELMHKVTAVEPLASGFLLSLVCFSGFKIEHISGHHVHVSTPKDYSSAPFNQSLYRYLLRALRHNFLYAFTLENKRLAKKGLSPFSVKNELIWWHLLSVLWMVLSFVFLGSVGLAFFLAQSFVAVVFLEIINYIEHYGLSRKLLRNGKYEPVTPLHSWNSNFLLTNLLLFQLQRHSDHHAYPKRRYQILRHFDESPQLPFGYPTMMVLALFPPLYRHIMNPLVMKTSNPPTDSRS